MSDHWVPENWRLTADLNKPVVADSRMTRFAPQGLGLGLKLWLGLGPVPDLTVEPEWSAAYGLPVSVPVSVLVLAANSPHHFPVAADSRYCLAQVGLTAMPVAVFRWWR